jgi:hypothetical protein
LLTPLEVKTIFSPILPIYSLHRRILRDMIKVLETWTEESLTGEIYVKYVSQNPEVSLARTLMEMCELMLQIFCISGTRDAEMLRTICGILRDCQK